jgi:hypothetical protein
VTDPKYARATDNGRYYEDPQDGAMVPSVTNVLSEWAKVALPPSAAKITAEYIMDHLPKAVRASLRQGTREAFLKEAKAEYKNIWEYKRDLGTVVHEHAEARILGRPIPPDERVDPFIDKYLKFLADFNVDIEHDIESTEITVFGRSELRYGGTADLWVNLRHLPRGMRKGRWLLDFKSSLSQPASAKYRENFLQLAALRHADVAVLPDDSEVKVPEFAGAAVLNLRQKSYGFIPLPADEAAHQAFLSMIGVASFAHALDMKPYKPIKAPVLRAVKKGA